MQQAPPSRTQTALAPIRRTSGLSRQTLPARQGTFGEAHIAERRAGVAEEIEERDQRRLCGTPPHLIQRPVRKVLPSPPASRNGMLFLPCAGGSAARCPKNTTLSSSSECPPMSTACISSIR